jgi:hypothetical protein
MASTSYGDDIYTEPADIDPETLANLGPLARLAGRWRGTSGVDVNPKAGGPETAAYSETIDLEPIDPQTNGPQLLYGLRYHQHVVRPGEIATYHDQVGYWLWEPATGALYQTVSIPRAQTVLAMGHAAADATRFELSARRGTTVNGIVSQPFLEAAFTTLEYRIVVTLGADGGWSYDEDTVMMIKGQSEPFHHRDINRFGGVALVMPVYFGLAMLGFFAGMGLPGLSGFVGEIYVLIAAFAYNQTWAAVAALGMILTAGYILWTMQRVYLGPKPEDTHHLTRITAREVIVLASLGIFTIVLGVYPKFATMFYDGTLKNISAVWSQ